MPTALLIRDLLKNILFWWMENLGKRWHRKKNYKPYKIILTLATAAEITEKFVLFNQFLIKQAKLDTSNNTINIWHQNIPTCKLWPSSGRKIFRWWLKKRKKPKDDLFRETKLSHFQTKRSEQIKALKAAE